MRIRRGLDDYPQEAQAIAHRCAQRRVSVRAAAAAVTAGEPEIGTIRSYLALDHIDEIPPELARTVQPRLHETAALGDDSVRAGLFEIELDAFERAVVDLADGRRTLPEIVALATESSATGDVPRDPESVAIRLLAVLARHEMLAL